MRGTTKEKVYASGAELAGNSQLRWKLCRVVRGRLYSLFNVGASFSDKDLGHCRRTGLVLHYAVGKETVGTFGGIYGYDSLDELCREYCPWYWVRRVAIVAGVGTESREQGLFLWGPKAFLRWKATRRQLLKARRAFGRFRNLGLCYLESFTPMWVCREFPKVKYEKEYNDYSLFKFEGHP